MKKQLLLLSFCFLLGSVAFGQTKFGAGVAYFNDLGIQGRAKLDLGDKLGAIPSLTYYFGDFTSIGVDGVVTYDVATVSEFPIYALGGLNWTRVSSGGFSNSELGINLGAGTEINTNIYVELRYLSFLCDGCGSDLGFNVGYYF